MRSLSDAEVLDLVDTGRLLSADERALSILRLVSGESEQTLAQLSRARLEALLIEARAETIGQCLEACIACAACGALLETTVECRDLTADPPDAFALTCDTCGERSSSPFDIRAFFWRELAARAHHIALDVHELARAYGWRESDVLSLSPARRRRYLELVGEPGPFEPLRDADLEGGAEGAAGIAVLPRAPHDDRTSKLPGAIRPAVPAAADTPLPSARARHETAPTPPMQDRLLHERAARSIVEGKPREFAARPARVVAAAPRRETASANPPRPAMPHVTVNIARIDVVATPAQAAAIDARQKRREAGMPLSTYLAERQTEER
jgi:hypothetical protein